MLVSEKQLDEAIQKVGIVDLSSATIRQICALANELEKETGESCTRLELGNPGLLAEQIGIEAEIEALKNGVANKYPDISGIPQIKEAGSEFVKAFMDLSIPPYCVIPTVGSMQACFTLMTLLKQREPERDSILLFSPGFPAQSHQAKLMGFNRITFDIYDYRGEKLREVLEKTLSTGKVCAMLYSNPNNPSWTNLTEEELRIIGEMATKYDVTVLEDLAYMGMDFRTDFSHPWQPPYVPSVGHYTSNYILMISASKIFSYAGQRVAVVCMSPEVFNRHYPALESFYEMPNFGEAYIYGVLYMASSGVTHSAQYAMAQMLHKACEGELPFMEHTKEYAHRAAKMKELFHENGFHLVYDRDGEEAISDGFFFTIGYGNMSSEQLQRELLRYGVCTIPLPSTGSTKDGVRICVSMMNEPQKFEELSQRLKTFHHDH